MILKQTKCRFTLGVMQTTMDLHTSLHLVKTNQSLITYVQYFDYSKLLFSNMGLKLQAHSLLLTV